MTEHKMLYISMKTHSADLDEQQEEKNWNDLIVKSIEIVSVTTFKWSEK